MWNTNINNLLAEIKRRSVLLYVGRKVTDEELIVLNKLSWSGIVTTRTDNKIYDIITKNEVTIQEVDNHTDGVKTILDNRGVFPVFRLFDVGQNASEFEAQIAANTFLTSICSCLDSMHSMVICGYDSSCADELPWIIIKSSLQSAPKCMVQFWNCSFEDNTSQFNTFRSGKKFKCYKENPAHELQTYLSENSTISDDSTRDFDVFYSDGKAIPVQTTGRRLERCQIARLLTENEVTSYIPQGTEELSKKYYDYLTNTPTDRPQWYGYDTKVGYNITRQYEENLYTLVNNMLLMKLNKDGSHIALLSGPSGSSKSVALGALAYRIFLEKKFPVVYINRFDEDMVMFTEKSSHIKMLDSFLNQIEDKLDPKGRILLIWDCSSYNTDELTMHRVANRLLERGRRFVMVCSSHRINPQRKDKGYRFKQKYKLVEVPVSQAQFYERDMCYCVSSTYDLNSKEKNQLRETFKKYANTSEETVNKAFKSIDYLDNGSVKDKIHFIFYILIALLRPKIERGMSSEEESTVAYLTETINSMIAPEPDLVSIDINKLSLVDRISYLSGEMPLSESYNRELSAESVEKIFVFIAMFSKFNLSVPYDLILNLLDAKFSAEFGTEILDLLIDLPMLYYHRDTISISFRNTFEAQIFLMNKDPEGKREFELLKYFFGEYMNQMYNTEMKNMLLTYLKMMGPNHEEFEIFNSSRRRDYFMLNMSTVVDMLTEILKNSDSLDSSIRAGLVWTCLTFTREHYKDLMIRYGSLDIDHLKGGVDALDTVLGYADDMLSLDKHYPLPPRDRRGIIIEYAFTNIWLKKYSNQYVKECMAKELEPDKNYADIKFPYSTIYSDITSIIPEDPNNGYNYNALLTCFMEMYDSGEWTKTDKMEQLMLIQKVISECDRQNMINTGTYDKDDLETNIQNIYQLSEKTAFTIDTIMHFREGITDASKFTNEQQDYIALYKQCLSERNPVVISFLCQTELNKVRAFDEDDMGGFSIEEKCKACEKVIAFMQIKEHFACVQSREYAYALFIFSMWMYLNHEPLNARGNRKRTFLSKKAWGDILGLCHYYAETFKPDNYEVDRRQRIILLLYALALLHMNEGKNNIILKVSGVLESIPYMTEGRISTRNRTLYMYCDEKGGVKKYTGKVEDVDESETKGHASLRDIDPVGKVHFNTKNIDPSAPRLKKGTILQKLEIGFGYIGTTLYTEDGRKGWGDNVE